MKNIITLIAILICAQVNAQMINPVQIRPGAEGQVLKTINGYTVWDSLNVDGVLRYADTTYIVGTRSYIDTAKANIRVALSGAVKYADTGSLIPTKSDIQGFSTLSDTLYILATKSDITEASGGTIQSLSSNKSGNAVSVGITGGGGGTSFSIADADSSVTNELQTITRTGDSILLSQGGGVVDSFARYAQGSNITITGTYPNYTINAQQPSLASYVQFSDSVSVFGTKSYIDTAKTNIRTELSSAVKYADTGVLIPTMSDIEGVAYISDTSDVFVSKSEIIGVAYLSDSIDVFATKSDLAEASGGTIQSLSSSKSGNIATLSISAGGTGTSISVADADSSTTNELQAITKLGNIVTLSNSGGAFTVADADSSSTNELQTISRSGDTITLSNSGGNFVDSFARYVQGSNVTITGSYPTYTINATQPSLSGYMQYSDTSTTIGTKSWVIGNGYLTAEVDGSITNELQNLSIGTRTSTTVPINISSGTGANFPIATTTLAGAMSAFDKAKLDSLSTSAGGTVTSFSSGNLSPLFTTSVATSTTTPSLSFALSNAGANTWFGNSTGSSAAPSYNSLAALTKTDDANVTLTLGGTPSTALAKAVSLTLGWSGQLAVSRGGTGASTLTGVVIGNDTSAMTAVSGTANQLLRRNAANTAYEFFTPSYGTVSSVNVSGSGALTFSGGPVTTSGTISAGWSGSTSQYVRGDGSLASFPTIPTVNNATLTLATSGIATGSQTFTANQSTNATFTVNVPATNVGGVTNEWGRVTSSTGLNGYIYGMRSFGNGAINAHVINGTETGMTMFSNTAASTNLPKSSSGNTIYVQTNIGSALGSYKIWSANQNDGDLYFMKGVDATTWGPWKRFAFKEWTIEQLKNFADSSIKITGSTSNTTPTTIATIPVPSGQVYDIQVRAIATQSGSSAASFFKGALIGNSGGTASVLGSEVTQISTPITTAGLSEADVTIDTSGGNLVVKVTGVATTVNWKVFLSIIRN